MTKQAARTFHTPPPIVRAAWVQRSQVEAFDVFTQEIGAWWPLRSHGVFGERAGGLFFRDDQLVEVATDGSEAIWAEIIAWEPPDRFELSWHPGQDAASASTVIVSFEPDGNRTRVVIEHRGWESFGSDALRRRRGYVGPNAWGSMLDHFADGAEARIDAVDLTALAGAYESFFAEAERGGFGSPPAGEWTAEQVIAHVTLNDASMLSVCQALVHNEPARFENLIGQDRAVLDAWVTGHGDLAGLIAASRAMARQFMAAVSRLSTEQRATDVHCRLSHDEQIVLDEPRSWGGLAIDVQAGHHLPDHTHQLSDLRSDS